MSASCRSLKHLAALDLIAAHGISPRSRGCDARTKPGLRLFEAALTDLSFALLADTVL